MRADESPRWILRRAVKAAAAGTFLAAGVHRAVRSWQRRRAGVRASSSVLPPRDARLRRERARGDRVDVRVRADDAAADRGHRAHARDRVALRRAPHPREPPGTRRRDAFVVTFDDGYADNHHVAMPVLAAMKVPATFFVATGYTSTSKRFPHDRLFASLTELGPSRHPRARHRRGSSRPAQPAPAATLERLIARLAHDRLMAIADALERALASPSRISPTTPAR